MQSFSYAQKPIDFTLHTFYSQLDLEYIEGVVGIFRRG